MAQPKGQSTSANNATTSVIESSVEHANKFLDSIHHHFNASKLVKAGEWLDEISRVKQLLTRSRTVIGFVGDTGTGKSTLLNAILDEEFLLPTSCTRACNSVVIEVSHNTSDKRYRAEIEFVSKEEWQPELNSLLQTVRNEDDGLSQNYFIGRTDEGRALSKLRAVYSKIRSTQFTPTTANGLITDELDSCLGTTIEVQENDPEIFHNSIRKFIEPKREVESEEEEDAKEAERVDDSIQFEFWPLVRVVRIYLKSPVLEEGAVLVDLPGVHDGNAARVATTEAYISECSAIFIVDAITRAIDNESTKRLLCDTTFKRQLQLDNNLGNLAIICTKADLISANEIDRELGLMKETKPARIEIRTLKSDLEQANSQLKQLRAELKKVETCLTREEHDSHDCDYSKEQPQVGELLKGSVSSKVPRKRKHTEMSTAAPCGDEDTSESSSRFDAMVLDTETRSDLMMLAKSIASSVETPKIQDDDHSVGSNSNRKDHILDRQSRIHTEIVKNSIRSEELLKELTVKQHDLNKMRVRSRNGDCKKKMKQRFADEIAMSDQDFAADAEDEPSYPTHTQHDCQELADELSVFCVSSNAYHQLKGRNQWEKPIDGFGDVADTEIPEVQSYCREIAVRLRTLHHVRFLNEVALLSNSLKLWTLSSGGSEEQQLQGLNLQKISERLVATTDRIIDSIRVMIDDKLCSMFTLAESQAKDRAVMIPYRWSRPVNKTNRRAGGLACRAYSSAVRNKGFFHSSTSVTVDFNRDLAAPLIDSLLPHWKNVFSQELTALINQASTHFWDDVQSFLTEVEAMGTRYDIAFETIDLIKKQAQHYFAKLSNALSEMKETIESKQKKINRQISPRIRDCMLPVYMECAQEQGREKFARMKTRMSAGVEAKRSFMYSQCVNHLRTELDKMIGKINDYLLKKVNEICVSVIQDCTNLQTQTQERIADEQRPLKTEIVKCINIFSTSTDPTPGHNIIDVEAIDNAELKNSLDKQAKLRMMTPFHVKQECNE